MKILANKLINRNISEYANILQDKLYICTQI